MPLTNHQFRLAARPEGLPKRSDWNYVEEPVNDPGPGQILIKILYISLDPAMRGWMNDIKSYVPPVGIGEVMRAGAHNFANAHGWDVGLDVIHPAAHGRVKRDVKDLDQDLSGAGIVDRLFNIVPIAAFRQPFRAGGKTELVVCQG